MRHFLHGGHCFREDWRQFCTDAVSFVRYACCRSVAMREFEYSFSAWLILVYQGLGFFVYASQLVYLPKLHEFIFGDANPTLIYGAEYIVSNFSAVICSIVADRFIGRFRVAFWSNQIAIFGLLLLNFVSECGLPLWIVYCGFYFGAFIVSVCGGAFVVSVPTLVADQLDDHSPKFATSVFHLHFLIRNICLFLATMLSPLMVTNVKCLGRDQCISLFYGVLLLVAVIAQALIFVQWDSYVRVRDLRPKRLQQFFKWMISFVQYTNSSPDNLVSHENSMEMVRHDANQMGRMAQMFLSLSFFYAMYYLNLLFFVDQGRRLSANVGNFFYLKPSTLANSRLAFNILFSLLLYLIVMPLIERKMKCTPLRRMVFGCICVVLSLTAGGIVETQSGPVYRHASSLMTLHGEGMSNCTPVLYADYKYISLQNRVTVRVAEGERNWTLLLRSGCGHDRTQLVTLKNELSKLFLFSWRNNETEVTINMLDYNEYPTVRTLFYVAPFYEHPGEMVFAFDSGTKALLGVTSHRVNELFSLESAYFGETIIEFYIGSDCQSERESCRKVGSKSLSGATGAVYAILTDSSAVHEDNWLLQLHPPNEGSILWQVPIYIFMSLGDCLVIPATMEFAYTESVSGFRTVAQGFLRLMGFLGMVLGYMLRVLIGNTRTREIFGLVVVMAVTTLVLAFHASKYKYVESNSNGATQESPLFQSQERLPLPSNETLSPDVIAASRNGADCKKNAVNSAESNVNSVDRATMVALGAEFFGTALRQEPFYAVNKNESEWTEAAEHNSTERFELNVSVFLPLNFISREMHLVLQTSGHFTGWFTEWTPKQWSAAHLQSVTIRGIPQSGLPFEARLVPENRLVDLIRLVGLPVSQDYSLKGATFLDVQNVGRCNAAVLLKLLNAVQKNFRSARFHDLRDDEFSTAFSKFLLRYITEARSLCNLTLNQCSYNKQLLQAIAPLFNSKNDPLSVDLRRSQCCFNAESVVVFVEKWKSSIGRYSMKPEKQILMRLESHAEWSKLKKTHGLLHHDRWQNEYISIAHPKGRSWLILSHEFFDRLRMLRIFVYVFNPEEAITDWALHQLFGSLAI
ncbi:hypothetical protein QR680_011639 [Steinernema hermaphroditum]|uniref:Uncharacterized protein n=1 Tax=Steinernema hermaphroditum TaxID=289476 RepID=A0AA39HZ73_9BILA|nr:hypothetical protein QR680_011639 [Steinernema hermaphroditum]